MMKGSLIIFLLFVILFGSSALGLVKKEFIPTSPRFEKAYALYVIDGDTIEVKRSNSVGSALENPLASVRLICINAPEKNQRGYGEAKQLLKTLVDKKEILLEKDRSETDLYGRLLRYVWLRDVKGNPIRMANAELARQGWVRWFPYGPDKKHCPEFQKLIENAKKRHWGLWT